jgi:arsenate reductase-like glutaredoxin family protein
VNQTIIGRHLLFARWYAATLLAMPGQTRGAPSGPTVQVFGTSDSQATRAALRFFRERRIDVHFVDIRRKPMAPAELRRFVDHLGARAVADESSKAWRDAGLGYLRMDDAELLDRLLGDQGLLDIPLVRVGNGVASGRDEKAWLMLVTSR